MRLDQTSAYIQRSRGAPLEVSLAARKGIRYRDDALLLTLPLIARFNALALSGFSGNILKLIKNFSSPAPLLERLDVRVSGTRHAAFESPLLGGNPSLRKLRLSKVITSLPWRNLSNLTTFYFGNVPSNTITVAQLLDFFEHAPLLRRIELVESLPEFSNAPAERVVYLPCLRFLRTLSQPAPSILLNHLHVPTGASVRREFPFGHGISPIPDYLPTPLNNLSNISHITSVNFDFSSGIAMRLNGPNGDLYVFGAWNDRSTVPCTLGEETLRSFNKLRISTIERLSITRYDSLARRKSEVSGAYQTLLLMNNLRTLTLIDSINLSFILALTPNENASSTVVCPRLEEYAQYIGSEGPPRTEYLLNMVEERASRGAKLSTIMFSLPQRFFPAKASRIRSYVSRVEYGSEDSTHKPRWDTIPGEADEVDDDSDW